MDKEKYELYVFDVDGTLYFQKKVRFIMVYRLATYYVCHLSHLRDLFIIKDFRAFREKAKDINNIYELTANKNKVNVSRVQNVIQKWIYENPLNAIKSAKDKRLLEIIEELKSNGKKVAIWSDYAATDKLNALGLECENVYTAEDEKVLELKPSSKGLNIIMQELKVSPENTLMIGDRMIKDGEAAKAAGVDYLILSSNLKKRKNQY